ncbi:amino acid ABC transporter permease [Achromobacter spanius]|uniref:amino acid ABC transporter permease n=1 Tax=Achromobacter spanius TaxID=217203 RepID=UPI003824FB15
MNFLSEYGPLLWAGLELTLLLSVVSWALAFVVGILLTLIRLAGFRPSSFFVLAFIEYQRNVPPLVHIFLWYFGVANILPFEMQDWINEHHGEFWFAAIAIGLYYGAYISEDIRSGLRSVPPGQMEAARALGLGRFGAMRRVILPQALRIAIPPLTSGAVMLVKTTGLAMVIGVTELTYATKDVANKTFQIFESYGISTAMYVLVALVLLAFGGWVAGHTRIKGR